MRVLPFAGVGGAVAPLQRPAALLTPMPARLSFRARGPYFAAAQPSSSASSSSSSSAASASAASTSSAAAAPAAAAAASTASPSLLPTTASTAVAVTASAAAAARPTINRGRGASKTKPTRLHDVVFVSSEVAPWSKTGGLGDVCGALPAALAARGHRVMVVAPRYAEYPDAEYTGVNADCNGNTVGYYLAHRANDGVDYVFVDHPSYPRPGGGFYSDAAGSYGDNQFRFALLSLAALEAPLRLRAELPAQFGGDAYDPDSCVFVANDWHAAMVPVYLASRFRPHGVYRGARTVAAIHNLIHQGVFPPSTFESLGVPGDWYGALEWQYPPHQRMGSYEEEGRAINTLKAALTTADRIVTVSPGYAWEITTPEGGCGLESLLSSRSYVLDGVLNGVDVDEWHPSTDRHLYRKYSAATVAEGKAANKAALQRELGLPEDPDAPLFAFIGRLDPQKGADLVLAAAPWLVSQGAQVVLLGSGDPRLEDGLRSLEAAHPRAARCWVGFNVPFSHRLTAAADVLLMPSVFEPCGLNQMYAFLAGTPVVAHATGGLRDTVVPYDPQDETNGSTGWTFSPCTVDAFVAACGHALTMYRDHPDAFARLRARCMARDCSWDGSAAQWEQIFDWSKSDPPYCP